MELGDIANVILAYSVIGSLLVVIALVWHTEVKIKRCVSA